MRRIMRLTMALCLLLAATAPVAAQDEADSAAASRKATGFTGTSTWGLQYEQGREVVGEGKVSMLGEAWQITLSDMSDPRMNGKLRIRLQRGLPRPAGPSLVVRHSDRQ